MSKLLSDVEEGLQNWLNTKDIDENGHATFAKRQLPSRIKGLKIFVYPNDHDHFHVVSTQNNLNARFNLNDADSLI